MMVPAYNRRGALLSIRDGNPLQANVRHLSPKKMHQCLIWDLNPNSLGHKPTVISTILAGQPIIKSTTFNPPPGIYNMEVVSPRNRKICWFTVVPKLHFLACCCRCYCFYSPMSGKFAYVQFFSTLPRSSESPHLLSHSPRLAYPPPNEYYYCDFN
ncbi:hypothetical protein TNCV_4856711 [Trichonephila clavipes]|nr:hypothetical protein TNCV_4856711 [Trichonephila clavipes]